MSTLIIIEKLPFFGCVTRYFYTQIKKQKKKRENKVFDYQLHFFPFSIVVCEFGKGRTNNKRERRKKKKKIIIEKTEF